MEKDYEAYRQVSAYCLLSILTSFLGVGLYWFFWFVLFLFFLKFPNFIYEFMRNFLAKLGNDDIRICRAITIGQSKELCGT